MRVTRLQEPYFRVLTQTFHTNKVINVCFGVVTNFFLFFIIKKLKFSFKLLSIFFFLSL